MALELVASFLLVVERNAVPAYAEELARRRHYRAVGRVESVGAAVETARTRAPDVLVADIVTAERLHEVAGAIGLLEGTRVVVVSSLPAEVALVTAMASGARAFLEKPVDPEVLASAVSSVLAGHAFVDPRSTGWLVELALLGQRARPDTGLTLRQSQVVALVRGGLTNREIGSVLGLSRETVKTHLREAMKRLGAHDRSTAIALVEDPHPSAGERR